MLLMSAVGHLMESTIVIFSSFYRLLASASDDETVRIWKRDETYVSIEIAIYKQNRDEKNETEKEEDKNQENKDDSEEDEDEENVMRFNCIRVLKGHRSGISFSSSLILRCS